MPDWRETQFRRAIENHGLYLLRPLFSTPGDFGIVERAAAGVRWCRELEEGWECIIPQAWRSVMSIESLRGGVLTIRVSDPAWAERLRFESPRLIRELSRYTRGVQRLRAVVRPAPAPPAG
jgi:hypothetical protein